MPLFGRSKEDPAVGAAGSFDAISDRLAIEHERFGGLSLPQRAAEVLERVSSTIDETPSDAPGYMSKRYVYMGKIRDLWLRDFYNLSLKGLSEQQRAQYLAHRESFELLIQETVQALVTARLLVRREIDVGSGSAGTGSATFLAYANSPDGRAALQRGDIAEVVKRRLPD